MKKILLFTLVFIMMFACVACSNENINSEMSLETQNGVQTESIDTNPTAPLMKIINKSGGLGSSEISYNTEISQNEFIPASDVSKVPIYKYDYATDDVVGEFLYEINTEDVLAKAEKQLVDFISCVYGQDVADEFTIEKFDSNKWMKTSTKQTLYLASPERIVVGPMMYEDDYANEFGISEDVIYGKEENKFFDTILQYIGIKNPQIKKTLVYDNEGNLMSSEFVVTEYTTDTVINAYNESFKRIFVAFYPNTKDYTLSVQNYSTEEYDLNITLPKVDEAESFVLNAFDLSENEVNVKSELIYSDSVVPGYYVPCYRVYVGQERDGVMLYDTIDVAAAEYPVEAVSSPIVE